jgi:hypothetical protein
LPVSQWQTRQHFHEEMGWQGKVGAVFHREYLDGATIEEVEVQS